MGGIQREPVVREFRVLSAGLASMREWPARRWFAALAGSTVAGLAIGVPSGVVPSSLYHRMTAVTWWDYPVWATSAILVGLTLATYVRFSPEHSDSSNPERAKRTIAAAVLSAFAVGCPICNKLIVGLIGVSGALNYWAPLQPLLGLATVALLATGLLLRLRGVVVCRATPTAAIAGP